MIVQPTSTSPRSPARRALRIAGLVLPVALLAMAVGAGVLGPPPEPALPNATAVPAALASSVPAKPDAPVAPVEAPAGGPPPDAFGGLPAIGTGELLAVRMDGITPVAVAVTGFLRVEGAGDCAGLEGGPLGPWCERRGTLGDRPWTSSGTSTGGRQPHVHVTIPVGVRLPQGVVAPGDEPGEGGVRVLVVGRFAGHAASCGGSARSCGEGFVAERFAWADGARVALTPLVDARLDTGARRPNPFLVVAGDETLPMAAVLVWPDDLARIDPAAGAVAAEGPPSEPLWYVRVLARGVERPGFRWLLLAERDLRVLGSGPASALTAASRDVRPHPAE